MPVTFGELSSLTTPVSVARLSALFFNCLAFSLAASSVPSQKLLYSATIHAFCMVTWCLFFILTFLIVVVHFIQFHNLLPFSWKNLTATVAAMAVLMMLTASFFFPWIVLSDPRTVAATVGSCLASLAYVAEILLIRNQVDRHQRGYMATVPGLLKVLQVFGGCVALVVLSIQQEVDWRNYSLAAIYGLCLLPSAGTVLVMLLDCAGHSPVPFDRLLTAFSLIGVILYMVATVVSFTRVLRHQGNLNGVAGVLISETVVTGVTLLAYTFDLAFSIKLLCDRT